MTATAPEPTDLAHQAEQDAKHRRLLWICGGVALVLVIIGLFAYSSGKDDREAQQKAQQLTQKLTAAGLPVPASQDTIIRALGNDGGAVCNDPGAALRRAILFDSFTNGASFVGRRPVIADSRLIQGEILILQTYCPDKVSGFQDKVKDVKTDDVIKN
jgi:hypothetical protein